MSGANTGSGPAMLAQIISLCGLPDSMANMVPLVKQLVAIGSAGLSGTGTVTSVGTGTGLTGGPITASGVVSLAPIASNNLLANPTGASASPVATTLSALIDAAVGSAQGDVLYRGASTWSVLAPGTSGYVLQTNGAAANPSWVAQSGGGGAPSTSTTFTPAVYISGSPSGATYTTQTGSYLQTGALTVFYIDVEWSAIGSAVGPVTITGLPAAKSGGCGEITISGYGMTTSGPVYGVVNTSGVLVLSIGSGGAASADAALYSQNLASAGGVIVNGSYFTA